MSNRRTFLFGSISVLAASLVAACTGTNGVALTPQQVISQAATLVKGLSGMMDALVVAYPGLIPANTLVQIKQYLSLADTAAASLSETAPAATSAVTVKTVEGYINAVLDILARPPINGLIPAPYNMAVAAADLLVPQLEIFVNTYIPGSTVSVSAVTPKARFRANSKVSNTKEAMTILLSYVKH